MKYQSMTTNERFKHLRKDVLDKTQLEFAKVLDMSHAGISKIESGNTALTEKNAKIICKEYDVNYVWLMYGEGEIFSTAKQALIDRLADEYKLSEQKRKLVERILALSDEEINMFTMSIFGFEFIKKD